MILVFKKKFRPTFLILLKVPSLLLVMTAVCFPPHCTENAPARLPTLIILPNPVFKSHSSSYLTSNTI